VYDAVGLGSGVRGAARASPGGAAVRLGAAPSGNVRDLGAAGPYFPRLRRSARCAFMVCSGMAAGVRRRWKSRCRSPPSSRRRS